MRQNGSKLESYLKPYALYIEHRPAQRRQHYCSLFKTNTQEK